MIMRSRESMIKKKPQAARAALSTT